MRALPGWAPLECFDEVDPPLARHSQARPAGVDLPRREIDCRVKLDNDA